MLRLLLVFSLLAVAFLSFNYFKPADTTQHKQGDSPSQITTQKKGAVSTIATNLEVPWAIAFLPDSQMLITERPGRIRIIGADGKLKNDQVAVISEVKHIGEGGLMGITIHPDFEKNSYVYVYYTYQEQGGNTLNKIVRYEFKNNIFSNPKTILDKIPGAANHNGGRLKFGPDKLLYATTGDAQEPSQSQDTKSLAGKILRMTDEGKPAPNNPFNNHVYSYGHRNPQGIAWDAKGQLWATEHGRSGIQSGYDELNKIESGKNYGWPTIEGDETERNMVSPIVHSGATDTWAPAGLAFSENRFYFGGLRGRGLYEYLNNEVTKKLDGEYGRIREVITGPDGFLYISTSNHDGRGNPSGDDDKIIRIDPKIFR